jgi:hypothetical protein
MFEVRLRDRSSLSTAPARQNREITGFLDIGSVDRISQRIIEARADVMFRG